MSRLAKLTARIDLGGGSGLEIGPLTTPIVTHEMGRIAYVDHASTEELRAKYALDANVDCAKIVDIDYVSGSKSLSEAVGQTSAFDYIIASHVIEHVPDLIGWLDEVHAVLRPGGVLTLAIPDKRFCFDLYRNPTTLADVVDTHLCAARRPTCRQVFDAFSAAVRKPNGALAWNSCVPGEPRSVHGLDHALEVARAAALEGRYADVHCSVFTPQSLALLLAQMTQLGLIHFAPFDFHATAEGESEFFVALQSVEPTTDTEERVTRARRFAGLAGVDLDLRDWRLLDDLPPEVARRHADTTAAMQAASARATELEATLGATKAEAASRESDLAAQLLAEQTTSAKRGAQVKGLEETLALLEGSTSWRLTAPLRRIRKALLRY